MPSEPRPGLGDRRIHSWAIRIRLSDRRLLSRQGFGLCCSAMASSSWSGQERTVSGTQSLSGCVRTRTRKAWSRNTETKPNFYWPHSWWWWFRAQASALQQATAFLGATNRDATMIPPVLIRRNTSTLNDTFSGDGRFNSSFVSADARRRRIFREPATTNGPTVPPRQYFRHCS